MNPGVLEPGAVPWPVTPCATDQSQIAVIPGPSRLPGQVISISCSASLQACRCCEVDQQPLAPDGSGYIQLGAAALQPQVTLGRGQRSYSWIQLLQFMELFLDSEIIMLQGFFR